ncbi:MAG: ParB/RepB/Spo0J family partition protein [Pseudomonadota bacterium]
MAKEGKIKPSRLGRGLSSLIGEIEGATPAKPAKPAKPPKADTKDPVPPPPGPNEIDISLISRNPAQPRRDFDEGALEELAGSLKRKGVLQAILVRPDPKRSGGYQIVAGERRWRAAKRAGLTSIPAVIRDLDELELLEIGIIENVQRADLNAIEEAEAYGALMKRFGRTQDALADSVGKSRAHIANTLRLLNLPESVRTDVREGRLSAGHARALLSAPDPVEAAMQVLAKKLSVREAEALVKRLKDGDEPSESTQGKPGKPDEKDVDTAALEADLSRTLGLDVEIRHKPGGGDIRIKYRDLEQLDDVCRRLTAKR